MLQTTHYELNKYEGTDVFNPISVENPSMDKIDDGMYANLIASVPSATHVLSGSVHAIVRSEPDAPMFRFVATAGFTYGDSVTVDGISYTAKTTSGAQMGTNSFVNGANVLCCLTGTELTFYVSDVAMAKDSEKLGGELPSYYAQAIAETASGTSYDNTTSGMTATNVQSAIDELAPKSDTFTPYTGETYKQFLDRIALLIDYTKITHNAKIEFANWIMKITIRENGLISFTTSRTQAQIFTLEMTIGNANNSDYRMGTITTAGVVSISDLNNSAAQTVKLYY